MHRRSPLRMALSLSVPLSLLGAVALPAEAFAQTPPPASAPVVRRYAPATPVVVEGHFARYLQGPHGRIHGIVLDNGAIVQMRSDAFVKVAPALRVGDRLRVEGLAVRREKATVIFRALVQRAGVTVADARNLPRRSRRRETI